MGDCLTDPKSYHVVRNLGEIPPSLKNAYTIQLLVRWRGYAQLESVRVGLETGDNEDKPAPTCEDAVVESAPCDYNDFEYSEDEPWL